MIILIMTGVNTERSRDQLWERCPQISVDVDCNTQEWLEIMTTKYIQASYGTLIIFVFCFLIIKFMLLIWSKSWNYILWLLLFLDRIKFVGNAQN